MVPLLIQSYDRSPIYTINGNTQIRPSTLLVDVSPESTRWMTLYGSPTNGTGYHQCQPIGLGNTLHPSQDSWPMEKSRKIVAYHLELLVIIRAFHAFLQLITGHAVQLTMDSTTALYYVNKQGSTHSLFLLYLTIELWEWCYLHYIFPIAVHIAMEENYIADYLSRLTLRTHEWFLADAIFSLLCHQ